MLVNPMFWVWLGIFAEVSIIMDLRVNYLQKGHK